MIEFLIFITIVVLSINVEKLLELKEKNGSQS